MSVNFGEASSGFLANSSTLTIVSCAGFKIGCDPDAVVTGCTLTNFFKSTNVSGNSSGVYLISSGMIGCASTDVTLSR